MDFLNSLMKNAPLGIISIDETGIITHSNLLAMDLLKIDRPTKSIVGHPVSECIQHIPRLFQKLSRYTQKGLKSFNIDGLSISERSLIVKGVSIEGGFMCIIHDVTRMKEMEVESIQSIIAGQENERRRIAREIHDGIGPLLSYAKLELDSFLDEFAEQNNNPSSERFKNIRNTLDSITSDLRDLSHHLIPRLLEEFGLFSAFNNLLTKINATGKYKVEFYCNFNSEIRFDKDIELNLYRCGQELINNTLKHAHASEILVQVIKHDQSIVLMVEDNGIGFESQENSLENFGIGLTNIETRVRTLNGAFIIESRENKGTSASIEIPI